MPAEILEKIQKLREFYVDGDKTSIDKIEEYEKDLQTLYSAKQYFELETTQLIVEATKAEILFINRKLSKDDADDKPMDSATREALLRERRAYLWYLRLLTPDYEVQVKSIEQKLDFELEIVP